ncbi:uncharacterized protein LOC124818438 isoform X2 [Hydra vulgaris]
MFEDKSDTKKHLNDDNEEEETVDNKKKKNLKDNMFEDKSDTKKHLNDENEEEQTIDNKKKKKLKDNMFEDKSDTKKHLNDDNEEEETVDNKKKKNLKDNSIEKTTNDCKNDPSNSERTTNYVIFSLFSICVVLIAIFFYKPTVIPQDHYYVTPETFQLKIDKMNVRFSNQDDIFWLKIKKLGYRHLKRVFKNDSNEQQPFTMLIAGYDGTNLTMKCFLKDLGLAFTDKNYNTLTSEGTSKESLDKQIQESLNSLQKYVVVTNIEQMTLETASIFMNYADEHIISSQISFPKSTIIMTAEMPFSFPENNANYNRIKEEEKVMKYFVNEIWGHDKNKALPLWSRIGNVVVLLKPENWADKQCS